MILKVMLKAILIVCIMMIPAGSYYGVVDENGERVTDIQQIIQEEKEKEALAEKTDIVEQEKIVVKKNSEIKEETSQKEKVEVIKSEQVKSKAQVQESQKVEIAKTEEKQEKVKDATTKKATEKEIVVKKVQEEKQEEKIGEKVEEKKQAVIVDDCSTGNHGMDIGNSGQWFNTRDEAIATYKAKITDWSDKWISGSCTKEEYDTNCPYRL